MDGDDLFSGSPAWESASSHRHLPCAEGSETVETFWMLEPVRGCLACDVRGVIATLSVCPSPGLLAFARCWSPGWLVAVEGSESGEHPGGVMLG